MRYIYGGEKLHIAILPGGNLLYSHFPAYPGKGEIWLWGKDGSITPAYASCYNTIVWIFVFVLQCSFLFYLKKHKQTNVYICRIR